MAKHVHAEEPSASDTEDDSTLIYVRVIYAVLVIGLGVLGVAGGMVSGVLWLIAGGLFLAGIGVVGLGWRRIGPSKYLDESRVGTVWWGQVDFEEGGGSKDRPVVEVGRFADVNGDQVVVAFPLTSQSKRKSQQGYLTVSTKGWDTSGRHAKSYVNTNRIVEMQATQLRRKAGAMSASDAKRVAQRWLVQRRGYERRRGFTR